MRKIWPFSFNFLLYAGIASVAPFIVLYYQGLGFTGTQIGVLTGITPLLTLVGAPLWTGISDSTRRHRLIMSLAILVVIITLIVYPILNTFTPVLLVAIMLFFFMAPVAPLADSAAMFMLADQKELYGRIRMGATIGFGLAAPITGAFVQNKGLGFAFWVCATFFLLALIVSQKLIYGQTETDKSVRVGARGLMTNPRWVLFLVVAFAAGFAIAAWNNYLFPYMKELGANETTMGLAILVGAVFEVPTLFFGNLLIKYFKPYRLLMLSMVITGVRMLLFSASRTPGAILMLQIFNGLTFATTWVAGVSYADEYASADMRSTAQGLFGAMVNGFGSAVGGFIGGPLLESIGGRGLYFVFGAAVLAIMAVVALIQRRLPVDEMAPLGVVAD